MLATAGLSKAFAPQIASALNKVDEGASNLYGKSFGLSKPELRTGYEQEVKNLSKLADDLKLQGKSSEEIAYAVSQSRRDLGIKYKDLTPAELREKIYNRNITKYGDQYGPTVDYLRSRGKSWEEIINSSSKPNGSDINFNK